MASGRTTMRSAFQNFTEIICWFEPRPDGGALSSGRSHFRCRQFPYQGFACPVQGNGHPDGWFDARNFHIWCSRIRTKKTGFWTSGFWMRYLPYGWASPDGNAHCRDGCSNLPISVFLKRNPIAGWTLSVVRTCCWNVRTDASWSSSKFLDTDGRPDGKFLSSGRMQGNWIDWFEFCIESPWNS
jgi:hypothetical protein